MARDDPEIRLRVPESLKGLIDASARANQRSLNAEIVSRLMSTFTNLEERVAALEGAVNDDGTGNQALLGKIIEVEDKLGLWVKRLREEFGGRS